MISRMDFKLFFGILIFYPKWGFCRANSLCMMADFQNGLISRIFAVFSSGFFAENNCKWCVEWILRCFLRIWIFDPKWWFCKACSLCMMADFQNGLISRIFDFISSGFFAQANSKWFFSLQQLVLKICSNFILFAACPLSPPYDGEYHSRGRLRFCSLLEFHLRDILAVFILEDALCVLTNLGKHSLFVWLFVSSVKTGTRRIIRLDGLQVVVECFEVVVDGWRWF